MPKFKLLTVGNPKIAKSVKFGYLTAVLHLAPGSLSGFNVCPKATAGCLAACLNTAGRGGITTGKGRITHADLTAGTRTNAIQAARVRKTRAYFADRGAFMATLADDIRKLVAWAKQLELKVAVRLNGTSDIPWERITVGLSGNIMDHFPAVQFYDYTKRHNRYDLPANYRLTFSLADGNDDDAFWALRGGMNVAAVFHKVPKAYRLPKTRDRTAGGEGAGAGYTATHGWFGNVQEFEVIDGDEHDLRFLDKPGVIVGLKAKGNAKRDTSGFVR